MAKHKRVKFNAAEMAYDAPAELDFARLREVPGGIDGIRRHAAEQRAKKSVMLDPDVAKLFPTSDAVNAALRLVAQLSATVKPKRKKLA